MIWAADALNGHVEALFVNGTDVDLLQIIEQGRAVIPGHGRRLLRDVVSLCRRYRNELDIVKMKLLLQGLDLRLDLLEARLRVVDEVHLVDGKDKVPDTHEGADAGMAARLRQDALRRVDEDDGKVCK